MSSNRWLQWLGANRLDRKLSSWSWWHLSNEWLTARPGFKVIGKIIIHNYYEGNKLRVSLYMSGNTPQPDRIATNSLMTSHIRTYGRGNKISMSMRTNELDTSDLKITVLFATISTLSLCLCAQLAFLLFATKLNYIFGFRSEQTSEKFASSWSWLRRYIVRWKGVQILHGQAAVRNDIPVWSTRFSGMPRPMCSTAYCLVIYADDSAEVLICYRKVILMEKG